MRYNPELGMWGNLDNALKAVTKTDNHVNRLDSRVASNEEVNNITFVALAETQVLDDDTAARHANVFEEWREGVTFKEKQMRRDPLDGKLYRVRDGKGHTSVEGWNPSIMKDSWVPVDVTHAGTIDDPIPAERGMEYVYGKYYFDEEVSKLYICQRTGEAEGGTIVLQYMPHEVVGNYFEEVVG